MKLSTGKVKFPIEFDNGDVQYIYFNPSDRDFIRRVMDFEKSIDERIKKISLEKYKARFEDGIDISIDIKNIEEISAMTEEEKESIRQKAKAVIDIDMEYQQAIKDELDDIFKSDISSVVFRYCQPMDMVVVEDENGEEKTEMFVIQFVNALAEELKKHSDKMTPAMEKHVGKYKK